jgi:DNA-binding response OmpR family regulator
MAEASDCVLIVEDDRDLADALRHWLERESMRVRVVGTGEQGLAFALDPEDPPALLLLDLTLPGMGGLELCRRLRREPQTRRTPVVIVTARASEEEDGGLVRLTRLEFKVLAELARSAGRLIKADL